MVELVQQQLEEAHKLLSEILANQAIQTNLSKSAELMVQALRNGNKIVSCGNGGSMSDAMHFAEELSARYRTDRPALAAVAISDPAHISCVANDYGYQYIFSRYIEALGQPGDVLLAISTSGNSANVLEAAKSAKAKGISVIVLSGNDGGKLADLADIELRVPHKGFADRIQEIHIKFIHILILLIEKQLGYAG
jgi:D-sedoheptulose 7-phosphate isomerase